MELHDLGPVKLFDTAGEGRGCIVWRFLEALQMAAHGDKPDAVTSSARNWDTVCSLPHAVVAQGDSP